MIDIKSAILALRKQFECERPRVFTHSPTGIHQWVTTRNVNFVDIWDYFENARLTPPWSREVYNFFLSNPDLCKSAYDAIYFESVLRGLDAESFTMNSVGDWDNSAFTISKDMATDAATAITTMQNFYAHNAIQLLVLQDECNLQAPVFTVV